MDSSTLTKEAEEALRAADPLCTTGDAYYNETKQLTEQSTVLWARIMFIHSTLQEELQSIGNLYVTSKGTVKQMEIQAQKKLKKLERSRKELRLLMNSLKETKVDGAFGGHDNLADYCHADSTALLEQRVDEFITTINTRSSGLDKLPEIIMQKLGSLRSQTPPLPDTLSTEILRQLTKINSKSGDLVQTMADLLTSLTKNYDLCVQIPTLSEEDAREATAVVLGDRDHVIQAIEQLNTNLSKLKTKCGEMQQLQHSLAMSFETFEAFGESIIKFISSELKHIILQIEEEETGLNTLFNQIDETVAEITGLTEYYRLFRKSYDALVIEVTRRHEAQKHLKKLVENANNALYGFQQREQEERSEFLQTYMEYIPQELWPGMTDSPMECSINFTPEKLPNLSKDALKHVQS